MFSKLISDYVTLLIDYPEVIAQISTNFSDSSVKDSGVVYTPLYIVKEMIRLADIEQHHTILEPSVGHGIFLYGLLEHSKKWGMTGSETHQWFVKNVTAIDINPDTVSEIRELLSAYFLREHEFDCSPASFTNILCMDGLTHFGRYNVCIGNPPYIRSNNIDPDYLRIIRKNFKGCNKGNVDLFYAFVEHAHAIADRVAFIVPNALLTNISAKVLRTIIEPRIEEVIDFKDKLIFDKIRTYTSIILLGDETDEYRFRNDLDEECKIIKKKAVEGKTSRFTVLLGIQTSADSIFSVERRGSKFYAKAKDGTLYQVEKEILAAFLKITKQKTDNFDDIGFMIFPYDKQNKIIAESKLISDYPMTYDYLLRQQKQLLAREKGKTASYDAWYAYSRNQGFNSFTDEVILVPRLIGDTSLPLKANLSELKKEFGMVLFTAGYVVPITEENKELCDFIFSDAFYEAVKKIGKPWAGGFFAITANHLRSII